ncbi:MAG: cupin domain-containing protein [Actinomycetota bacterium]|nr:cupin domain-containing protein [Actinomycetota bacterium]
MIENSRTGEQVEFLSETPELLVMDVRWTRPGRRAVEHLHPGMEERWEVLEGRAAFRIGGPDGATIEATPGSVVTAPKGVRHLAWNPAEAPTRLRIEMRPALRWAEFVRRFFAGDEDPMALLAEFSEEIALPADP